MLFDKREAPPETGNTCACPDCRILLRTSKCFIDGDLILSSLENLVGIVQFLLFQNLTLFKNHEMRTTITNFLVSCLNMIRT